VFKPSEWLDMLDAVYSFDTLAYECERSPYLAIGEPGSPYLQDIIDNIKNIDK
jgi:hypothetical protein